MAYSKFKQVQIEEVEPKPLNIIPVKTGSTIDDGDFSSKNFRTGRSGFRLRSDGTLEAQQGTFGGTFNIGGTTITIDNTEDIQTNLDLIEAEGGGTLYLQSGTYTLTADISIPGGVTLQGVSRDGVIIDCNNSYAVKIVGSNAYSTGTLSITNGGTTVTGSGTTWTAVMVGRSIFLDGAWYEITARNSNTEIIIGGMFTGSDLSGASYVLATVNFNATVSRVTVTNATGSGVITYYSQEPNFRDLIIYGCGTGLDCEYCIYPNIFVSSTENGVNMDFNYTFGFKVDFSAFSASTTGAGVVMTNSGDATFFDSAITGNAGDGLSLTSCRNTAYISLDIASNGGQGVELVSGNNDIQFIAATAKDNTSDGYKLTATSDRITISNCSVSGNGGYGINIAASTCDGNVVSGVTFSGNTTSEINDSGTGTIISSCFPLHVNIPQIATRVLLTENVTAGQALVAYQKNSHSIDLESGSSQYLYRNDAGVGLGFTSDFSLECWVKPESQPGTDARFALLTKHENSGGQNQRQYFFAYTDVAGVKKLELVVSSDLSGTDTDTLLVNQILSNATWYHVAVTWKASTSTATFYVNGAQVGSPQVGSVTSLQNSDAPFCIGTFTPDAPQAFFDGLVDDARAWNDVRTAAEILANYDNELVGNEANLQGYWKLNNALTDSTANAYTLTNAGVATFSITVPDIFPTNEVRLADASVVATADGFVGFARTAGSDGDSINCIVSGVVTGLSGLVQGTRYYLSDTSGSIQTTAGTVSRKVGIALSATTLLITNIW